MEATNRTPEAFKRFSYFDALAAGAQQTELQVLTRQLRLHGFGAVAWWEEVQGPGKALLSIQTVAIDEGRV